MRGGLSLVWLLEQEPGVTGLHRMSAFQQAECGSSCRVFAANGASGRNFIMGLFTSDDPAVPAQHLRRIAWGTEPLPDDFVLLRVEQLLMPHDSGPDAIFDALHRRVGEPPPGQQWCFWLSRRCQLRAYMRSEHVVSLRPCSKAHRVAAMQSCPL